MVYHCPSTRRKITQKPFEGFQWFFSTMFVFMEGSSRSFFIVFWNFRFRVMGLKNGYIMFIFYVVFLLLVILLFCRHYKIMSVWS
jgi:hypothetical protein